VNLSQQNTAYCFILMQGLSPSVALCWEMWVNVQIGRTQYMTLWNGVEGWRACRCWGRPDRDQQHCYHQAPKVKPEAATAVVELLMMGARMSETCWAVHVGKHQVINLRNCCIWLVDLFELFVQLQPPPPPHYQSCLYIMQGAC